MEKYSVGQKLVCINKESWYNPDNGQYARGPKYNEIVTYKSSCMSHGYLCDYFDEYVECYLDEVFVPLVDNSVLEEQLKEIFEGVNI